MARVQLRDVCKSYGTQKVIHEVNLEIDDGEFVVFVGPSGCGKSTLLRMISGLEDITNGQLLIDGEVSNRLTPKQRNIAMVFQSYALYPQMTVYQNMAFSLSLERRPKDEIDRRVRSASASLQLDEYLQRKPNQLSGGQRQRVAIGRAIVREPRVFLLDEPLSNLDAALRAETRVEIGELHQRLSTTMIYVTHDQVEAMTMADKIVVLDKGRVQQVGTPMELYNHPKTRFVATFIGSPKMNVVGGQFAAELEAHEIGVRPEHLTVDPNGSWTGKVSLVERLGSTTIIHAKIDGIGSVTASLDGQHAFEAGEAIALEPRGRHLVHRFDASGKTMGEQPAGAPA